MAKSTDYVESLPARKLHAESVAIQNDLLTHGVTMLIHWSCQATRDDDDILARLAAFAEGVGVSPTQVVHVTLNPDEARRSFEEKMALGICPTCDQSVRGWKSPVGSFAPEAWDELRRAGIDPATGHKDGCKNRNVREW